jgi:hypothetical protein
MTQAGPTDGTNVRSAAYLVAHSVGACERCQRPTSLFSVGLLPGHERHLDNEWVTVNSPVLLFQVEHLATDVISVLSELSQHYRLTHSGPTDSECWLNHCQHCGAPQEDYWLHCEPEGAFMPTSVQAAEQVQFVQVQGPFAAAAMGFSDGLPHMVSVGMTG